MWYYISHAQGCVFIILRSHNLVSEESEKDEQAPIVGYNDLFIDFSARIVSHLMIQFLSGVISQCTIALTHSCCYD